MQVGTYGTLEHQANDESAHHKDCMHGPQFGPSAPKTYPRGFCPSCNKLILFRKTGAGEGIRTLDPNLGKVVLYP